MPYNYKDIKPKLFTEEGVKNILKVRDHVRNCLKMSGAVSMERAMSATSGDSWTMMAYVDYLVELGEITEVKQSGDVAGQWRIFR